MKININDIEINASNIEAIVTLYESPFPKDDNGLFVMPVDRENSVDVYLSAAQNARKIGGTLVVIREDRVCLVQPTDFIDESHIEMFGGGKKAISYVGDADNGQLLADAISLQVNSFNK